MTRSHIAPSNPLLAVLVEAGYETEAGFFSSEKESVLDDVDLILVGVGNPGALGSVGALGALDLVDRIHLSGAAAPKFALFVDDGNLGGIVKGLRAVGKDSTKVLRKLDLADSGSVECSCGAYARSKARKEEGERELSTLRLEWAERASCSQETASVERQATLLLEDTENLVADERESCVCSLLLRTNRVGASEYGDRVEYLGKVAGSMVVPSSWPMTIIPKFGWGSGDLIVDGLNGVAENVVFWDPSAFVSKPEGDIFRHPRDRDRSWVVSTEKDHQWVISEFSTTGWPLRQFGQPSLGQLRLTHDEFLVEVQKSTGYIHTPAGLLGSGWFSWDLVDASRTGSIVYMEPRDAAYLPVENLHLFSPPVSDRLREETLPDDEIAENADKQRTVLMKLEKSKDEALEILKGVL